MPDQVPASQHPSEGRHARRGAAEHAVINDVSKRGAQHGPKDLDASASERSATRQTVQPGRHVRTFQSLERYAPESGLHVFRSPPVLRPRLRAYVGLRGKPPIHSPCDVPPVGLRYPVSAERRRSGASCALARERSQLSRQLRTGGGLDSVDAHHPLPALLPDGRVPDGLPRHETTLVGLIHP